MKTLLTVYSVYEVDEDGRRIRRIQGQNEPCKFIGEDGVWRDYIDSTVSFDGGIWFWNAEGKGFCTSTIVRVVHSTQ